MIELPTGNAICYSGYRRGQSPGDRIYPSLEQIREDLLLLGRHWQLLRLYDSGEHARRVLEVIRTENLSFKVMLGAHLAAELSNPGCPWGAHYAPELLAANVRENDAEIARLIDLAASHPEVVFAAAVGNEATVDWTDHLVPVGRMIEMVRRVRTAIAQPVTVCENYVPWQEKLADLAAELDFLSLHTYPVWEYKTLHEALEYTRQNYHSVARRHPHLPVVISEAGWTTRSNGRGIPPQHAGEEMQARYYADLMAWSRSAGVLTFVFEAFDEPWKGSSDPLEPEKHWGLFTVERRPKHVMRELYPDIVA